MFCLMAFVRNVPLLRIFFSSRCQRQRKGLVPKLAAERTSSPAGAAATAWCRAKQECGPGRSATPGSTLLAAPLPANAADQQPLPDRPTPLYGEPRIFKSTLDAVSDLYASAVVSEDVAEGG